MATTAAAALLIWMALAVAACLAMHRARQAAPPPPQPPDGEDWPTVEMPPVLPPVPGPATDTAYFAVLPVELCGPVEIDRRFVAAISAEWEWTA